MVFAIAVATAGRARADTRSDAKAHFAAGMKLLDQGDQEHALKEFEAAYALIPSPKIQFNMGIAHQALGHNVEALDSFDLFLAGATEDIPQEKLDQASKHRRELLAKVAAITVTCDRRGVAVSIDGVVRGKTPFAHPLYTEPGAHLLLAEGGGRSTSQTFAATRGTALTIPISFAANPTPAPSSEPTATTGPAAKPAKATPKVAGDDGPSNGPATTPSARGSRVDLRPRPIEEPAQTVTSGRDEPPSSGGWRGPMKWTCFGLAAAGAAGGVLETLTAIQKSKDFRANPTCMDNGKGLIHGDPECVQIDHAQTLATWLAVGAFGAAGALMTTGLILHFNTPSPAAEGSSGTSVSLACSLGASLTGASCVARW
jgi:hypothetical protein